MQSNYSDGDQESQRKKSAPHELEMKKYSTVKEAEASMTSVTGMETASLEEDDDENEDRSANDSEATGGEDQDEVDTDEDIENQAQPDFSPCTSTRRSSNQPDSERERPRGLGAHHSLRQEGP